MQSTYHIPVLLHEVIDSLQIRPDGVYVDCTFGGGGHARAILEQLGPNGKLIAFDQDADAQQNLPKDERLIFVPQNFRHLQRFLRLHKVNGVDGLLADLGVSSHQFDEAARGFSTRFDAALDMRMDQRESKTAWQVVETYTEAALHKIFEQYGEVTNAKTLARIIVQVRQSQSLRTIEGFKQAVHTAVKGNPNKYFAQVFQALRIEVNDEFGSLRELLQQLAAIMNPGGRVAIITFHSLEDRLVKHFFRTGIVEEKEEENPFWSAPVKKDWQLVNKKPIVAGKEEQEKNSRSRSAKLRVAEKCQP
ncbi:MAG: 16S rRNA (cytosine(1402)-N(4))-methyltransferase RsmH [Chitinophagaceae bacterium]|nr:16S rRNA (cytosine(1402)-N(4))-methyltransferase RsmH [Chitinophagaceae bacterium]